MSDECPKCRWYAADGKPFCGACGRSLSGFESDHPFAQRNQNTVPNKTQSGLAGQILMAACILIIFIAFFEVLTLLVHSGEIFGFLSNKTLGFFIIIPTPYVVFHLQETVLQEYWVLVVLIIVSCAAAAIWKFIETIKSSHGFEDPDAVENTAVFWVSVSLAAIMAVNFVVTFIVLASGSDITVPDFGDKIETMFLVADAAVWEEVVARTLYIGVPMMFISLLAGKKGALRCLLGGFGMSMTAAVLIIISGVIFGLAHYSGWDDQAWKVLTAGIMGMFLGYVFVRFGLYASILLHFMTNYLSSFDWMGVGGLEIFVTMLLLGLGFIALFYILKRLWGYRGNDTIPILHNDYIKK